MNWSFSIPANLILVFLFCFSLFSFYTFFVLILELSKFTSPVFRKSILGGKTTEEDLDLLFSPLERKLSWLPTIASLAMLLGLLGTVIGISSSFSEMQTQGKVSLEILAGGMSDALFTTIIGLLVAVPSLLFHRICENYIQKVSELFAKDSSNQS
ncbi:MotA/TolQ/ExbB proton channel family protein [Leptospira sp. 96542]|nr:MotA/TolQ/ExbB proton channel family protein [Leptospira sp. 96542]